MVSLSPSLGSGFAESVYTACALKIPYYYYYY